MKKPPKKEAPVPAQRQDNTREAWLLLFCEKYLWPRITAAGGARPERYRVSVGFPKGVRGSKKGIRVGGQAWSKEASADGTFEIFISPEVTAKPAVYLLAHELVHTAVGLDSGHKGPFYKLATAIGLIPPLTIASPGPTFEADIDAWLKDEVPYPHAPLIPRGPGEDGESAPGSRLLKAECLACGYCVRVTKKWAKVAIPLCPNKGCAQHQVEMEIDLPATDSDESGNEDDV